MLNIVLVEPEIPQNAGNIARTCVLTETPLHLVKPLGFSLDDRYLKRAGLDYWQYLKLFIYEDFSDFENKNRGKRFFLATIKGKNYYNKVSYKEDDFLIFGSETRGLDPKIIKKYENCCMRIPMADIPRSLNLSNSAAIVLYEALRQLNFPNLK